MVIYLDMDGVIADFFNGIETYYEVNHWKSIKHRDGIFVELRDTDFFYQLKTFKADSHKIVRKVQEIASINKIDWGICSSPLRGDTNNSSYWKRRWLEKQSMVPPKIENMIFTSNKHKYAIDGLTRTPNILIDDKPENIRRWKEAGGIGIRFQCNEDDIEEYLFVELERAIAECNSSNYLD